MPGPIKTEAQYRAEASRYDAAIRAINGILTMKLDTQEDLRAALTIVEQHRSNLKLFRSKLVVLGLGHATFSNAAKRKMPTREEATAFLTQVSADRTRLTTIQGFQDLQTQFKKSGETAILNKASERLRTATQRLRAATHLEQPFSFVNATFSPRNKSPEAPVPQDPITIIAVAYVALVVIAVVSYGAGVVVNASTDEGRDAVAECQDRADANYDRCVANADFFTRLGCALTLLGQQALCISNPAAVR
jgi:hypothetical protein